MTPHRRLRAVARDPRAAGDGSPARHWDGRLEAADARCSALLAENVALVSDMRENLQQIQLMPNIPLMRRFRDNVAAAFGALDALDADLPPFPVEVNTMYVGGEEN